MNGRFVDLGIRLLAAVGLALAVMSSPIRPSRASHAAPAPDGLPRNFAVLKIGQSGPFALSARPSLREADSLHSDIDDELDADIEDEPTVTSQPASVSFDVVPSSCREACSEEVRFAVAPAPRPLRC